VHRRLPGAGDGEIVRDAKLMRRRIEQPVADLAILLRAVDRRLLRVGRGSDEEQQRETLHGSLRATIFTGS
jgi:hypothetical protein